MNAANFSHVTVLLHEAVAALAVRPDGCYLDGTFGRGGHSREVLRAHISTCVIRDIRDGRDEVADELMQTLERLMR